MGRGGEQSRFFFVSFFFQFSGRASIDMGPMNFHRGPVRGCDCDCDRDHDHDCDNSSVSHVLVLVLVLLLILILILILITTLSNIHLGCICLFGIGIYPSGAVRLLVGFSTRAVLFFADEGSFTRIGCGGCCVGLF